MAFVGDTGSPSSWGTDEMLQQACALMVDARAQALPADRFRFAHLAALRAAAAVLRAGTPVGTRLARRPTSAWVLLEKVRPELGPWAQFFAGGARLRAAADAGAARCMTEPDADAVVEAAGTFLVISRSLIALGDREQAGLPAARLSWIPTPPAPPQSVAARPPDQPTSVGRHPAPDRRQLSRAS